jgi:PadR family transcriptional regulator, regulatory protein PadR
MDFSPDLMKGTMAPMVLRLVSEREMYGYEIVKVVNERTAGRFEWKEGSLYPCLHRLEADGLVSSIWRNAPNGKPRKYYRITRRGRAELEARQAEWADFAAAVNAVLMQTA